MMKNKQKPAREELDHLIQKIDGMIQEQGMSGEDIMRWLQFAEHDQVPIETAEWLDQAISQYEYGNIVLTITHHEITSTSASPSTKTVSRSRNGNKTLQLPKRSRRGQKELDTNRGSSI